MNVNTEKFNGAYHEFKKHAIEAKKLGIKIQRSADAMLEAINENGGEKDVGKHRT